MPDSNSITNLNDDNSRFVVLAGNKLACAADDVPWQPLTASQVASLADVDVSGNRSSGFQSNQLPLGRFLGHSCSLISVEGEPELGDNLVWQQVRALVVSGDLPGETFQLVSTALQVQTWQQDHKFCGRCGKPTSMHDAERAMVCEACQMHYYPRLSPCIITVVTNGEYCLLAEHQRYRNSFYSALAGFVEAGETLEQCLHREVMEEVGLKVKNLRYFGSQPWPFPGQLMVGFHAEYAEGDIRIDREEISDARWWHFNDLPMIPPPTTLSGQLIQAFVARHGKTED